MSERHEIARLGGGKWHIVGAYGREEVFTACSVTLKRISSPLHTANIEQTLGQPDCKNCLRWLANRDRVLS